VGADEGGRSKTDSARGNDPVRVATIGLFAGVGFTGIRFAGIGPAVVTTVVTAVVARVGFRAGVDAIVVAAAADDRGRQSECAGQRHDEQN
jgi:hypothetical protein